MSAETKEAFKVLMSIYLSKKIPALGRARIFCNFLV